MALLLRPILDLDPSDLDATTPTRLPFWAPLLRFGVGPFLLAGDLVASLLAGLIASSPRYDVAILAAVLALSYGIRGLYRSKLILSVLDDVPALVLGWLVAVAAVLAYHQFALQWIGGLRMLLSAIGLVVLFRTANYAVVRMLRQRGLAQHRTLILGADSMAEELAERLIVSREYGLYPIGFVDAATESGDDLPVPILGRFPDLKELLGQHNPHALIVSRGAVNETELVSLLRDCHRHRCEVFVVPRLSEIQHKSVDTEFVWGIPMVRLRRAAYRTGTWRLKRLMDIGFALIALIVLSPVLLACALAVRLADGPGGVIFRQERIGVDGRRFELMKFRSMKPATEQESQVTWNIANDARLGQVGRVLRKTSLDELPQLINILRGQMSIVGPRPERPHFVDEFGRLYTGYAARHRVPCGLTGWAQIHGLRGDTPIADRARFDNWYIENWSLWLDLTIILRTVTSVFRSPGA